MIFQPDLRLLVASGCEESDASAYAAVGQLSAACDVDLTVARVVTGNVTHPALRTPAFDYDAAPRRLRRLELRAPNAVMAIARLCEEHSFDLVLAPASPGTWPWRALRPSFRRRLMSRASSPVWTAGAHVPTRHFLRPIRSVACLLDFDGDPQPLIRRAAAFARWMRAGLHVLSVLPPIDDGTLATVLTSDTPLVPEAARERIAAMCAGRPEPTVDVVVDNLRRGVRRLIKASPPDLLFVRASQWVRFGRFGSSQTLDSIGCPVISVPDPDRGAWSFERSRVPITMPTWDRASVQAGPVEPSSADVEALHAYSRKARDLA